MSVQHVVVQDVQVHQVLTAELALEFEPLSIQAFQGSHFIREWFVDIIFVILEVGAVFEGDNAKFTINGAICFSPM